MTDSPKEEEYNPEYDLVTVASFGQEYEATLFAGKLESEGIETFLLNSNTLAAHPFLSNAIGGIGVQIKASQAETVKKMLADGTLVIDSPHMKKKELVVNGHRFIPAQNYCPECDESDVYVRQLGPIEVFISFLMSWMTFLPGPFPKKYYCKSCENIWGQ